MRWALLLCCFVAAFAFSSPGQAQPFGYVVAQSSQAVLPGNLDAGFGINGAVHLPFTAQTIGIQPDQKVVLAGVMRPFATSVQPLIFARFNTDGSPDTSFGGTGVVTSTLQAVRFQGRMLVQPDSKLLVAVSTRASSPSQSFVARINADGSVDTTFGAQGVVEIPFDPPFSSVDGFVQQSNGATLVLRRTTGSSAGTSVDYTTLLRLTQNGVLDTTFGTNGKVDIRGSINPSQLVLQADDSFNTLSLPYDRASSRYVITLLRFDAMGMPLGQDTAFIAPTDVPSTQQAITRQGNTLFVGGLVAENGDQTITRNKVRAFTTSGTADTTFGNQGEVLIPPLGSNLSVRELVPTAEGGVIVLGTGGIGQLSFLFVVRLNKQGAQQSATTSQQGAPLNQPSLLYGVVQADQKLLVTSTLGVDGIGENVKVPTTLRRFAATSHANLFLPFARRS